MSHSVFLCLLLVRASCSDAGPAWDQRPSINVIADQPVGSLALALGTVADLDSHGSMTVLTAQQHARKMDKLLQAGAGRLRRLRAYSAEARHLLLDSAASLPDPFGSVLPAFMFCVI